MFAVRSVRSCLHWPAFRCRTSAWRRSRSKTPSCVFSPAPKLRADFYRLIVLTLISRTLGRIALLLTALALLLSSFQVALVAIASSLSDSNGFERLAGLAPLFIQQAFGPALTSFGGMTAVGFFEPLIVMLVVEFAIYVATEPAGDVESGLVDLVLARPMPRHRLMTRSLIVMTGAALVLPLTMTASLWISLWLLAPAGARWPEPKTIAL